MQERFRAGQRSTGMRSLLLLAIAACGHRATTYDLDDLPVTAWTAGLPVRGDGQLLVTLVPLHPSDWSHVTGTVDFACDGCTLGDDRAKLDIPSWDGDDRGVPFGHLTFDTVRAHAAFAGGHVHLTSHWRSSEFVLDADVSGTLAPAADDIEISGCVAFRVLEPLRRRDPKLHALLSITGAPIDERGTYHIKLAGTLGKLKRLGRDC